MAQNHAEALVAAFWLLETVRRLTSGYMGVKAGDEDWCMCANALVGGQLRAAENVIEPLLPEVERLRLGTIECGDLSETTGFKLALALGRYVGGILVTGLRAPTAEDRMSFVLRMLGTGAVPKPVEWSRLRARLELEADLIDQAKRDSPTEGNAPDREAAKRPAFDAAKVQEQFDVIRQTMDELISRRQTIVELPGMAKAAYTAVQRDDDAAEPEAPATENERGVSLYDIAFVIEEDDSAATQRVKAWSDSKRISAKPIGKCPLDGRRQLYRLSELLSDVKKLLSLDAKEVAKYRQALTAKLREPRRS